LHGHLRSGDILVRPGLRVVVRKVRRQKVFEAQLDNTAAEANQKAGHE
jgi:hypothetical protein